jgi:hypothetical protein
VLQDAKLVSDLRDIGRILSGGWDNDSAYIPGIVSREDFYDVTGSYADEVFTYIQRYINSAGNSGVFDDIDQYRRKELSTVLDRIAKRVMNDITSHLTFQLAGRVGLTYLLDAIIIEVYE